MKKITIAFLFLIFGAAVNAQDFKKVETFFILKKVDDAKIELEKTLKDPKAANSALGQLWKARIYATLFADTASRAKYPNAGDQALEAFRNYMKAEPDAKQLTAAGLSVVDQLYVTNFNLGRQYFDQQQWDNSLKYFKSASEMGDYITQKNWKNNKQAVDTFTVLFTGYAAQNAKKLDDAATYYKLLADKEIGGKDYQGIYEFLTKYYLNNKNEAEFNKYLAIAKKLYPDNTLWSALQLAFVEENSTLEDKIKKYDESDAAGTLTADEYNSYGNMFAGIRRDEAKGVDSTKFEQVRKKAIDAFIKAYNKDNNNGIAAYNAGVVLNNTWSDLRDRYASYLGTSPALKAKRDEIDKLSQTVTTDAINWLEKAFNIFNAKTEKNKVEKNSYSTSIRMLTNLYEWKRDKSRGKSPADYDKYNAKFNYYNALFSK